MIEDRTGQRVPEVTFHTRTDHDWVDVTTDDLFKGKTVVLFALPGAYTPTCSSSHLPRYNQLTPEFKKHGVDDVICLSVNDTFVMNAWQKAENAHNVTMLPDGNGEFSEKMGTLVDKDDLGFGKRSWRYSMLVKDGVIAKMFIEQEVPGDPYDVSDADTMLKFVAPDAPKPHDVTVFTREGCPFCFKAKEDLRNAGIRYEELVLNRDFTEETLRAVADARTLPQVFVDGKLIGGSEDTAAWLKAQA